LRRKKKQYGILTKTFAKMSAIFVNLGNNYLKNPVLRSFGGAGAASFWWSQSRIFLVESELAL
jgi:hypothetical protein